ncbi:restriction endonuclease [Ktedonobacter robiniae]|uniref:Restriction endonuclease n=1 Tax=Ktedonobacter robiniae TaxID=2778365 RepID=A0ABQ3UTJ4_9CHLR|nr:restriction endonuclease [Ktedonobacter robiniae]
MEISISKYIDITFDEIRSQIITLLAREMPPPGKRQAPFNPVETLLCYGLFTLVNPHTYGGGNIASAPQIVHQLAALFRRSPGSITSKMLNLEGARTNGAREEPLLFATLASQPDLYPSLYRKILGAARDMNVDAAVLPDFLGLLTSTSSQEELLAQDEVSESLSIALSEAETEMEAIEQSFQINQRLTEKLVERKVRLAQHRFALAVLENCNRTCVFCGFAPHSLYGRGSNLLRASHIKPWAKSTPRERIDVRNGVAACPTHDAAFDQGLLAVDGNYAILRSHTLQESIRSDLNVALYFGNVLSQSLVLPGKAHFPDTTYLQYHLESLFKGL